LGAAETVGRLLDDGLRVVERVRAGNVVERVPCSERPRLEAERLDDTPDEPAAAPTVREHGEHERLVGDDEQERLVTGRRALVVPRIGSARELANPPPERVAAADPLRLPLLQPVR